VSGPISLWKARHRESSFLSCASQLISWVLLAVVLIVPFVVWWCGIAGIRYFALASLINLILGVASLAAMFHCVSHGRPLEGMLLSMGIRMVPPLALCLWLATIPAGERDLVFIFSLIFSYLVVLAAETVQSVKLSKLTSNLQ